MTLLTRGEPTLDGGPLTWSIDADKLTDDDIATAALLLAQIVGPYAEVEAADGGSRLAEALTHYRMTHGPLVIAGGVHIAGDELERQRAGRDPSNIVGVVIFNAGELPVWCRTLFDTHSMLRAR